jgi:hypothetical protein
MTVNTAVAQLLEVEEKRKEGGIQAILGYQLLSTNLLLV